MVENMSLCDAGGFLKYEANNFEEDMLDFMREETCSSFYCMYALASVACCNIRSIYPESKNPFSNQNDFLVKRNNFSSGKSWKHGINIMITHNKYWFGNQLAAKPFYSFDPWTTHPCKTKRNSNKLKQTFLLKYHEVKALKRKQNWHKYHRKKRLRTRKKWKRGGRKDRRKEV